MKRFSLYFNPGPSNTIYPNDKYRYKVEINVHISVMLTQQYLNQSNNHSYVHLLEYECYV